MKPGVVAIIDALGFRGIWAEFPAERLLDTLRRVRDEARRQDPGIHVRLLSDTIVLASELPGDEPGHEGEGASLVARFMRALAGVQTTAALSDPPLLYRGCVAYGSVLIDEEFVVGQAVDEAAKWMEQADGAFIWLTPSAVDLYAQTGALRFAEGISVLEYDVPMRDGRTLRTLAVNPLGGFSSDGSSDTIEDLERRVSERMALAFERGMRSMPVEVLMKKQKTMAFLEAASRHKEHLVAAETAFRRSMWGGRDPMEDASVMDDAGDT